MLDQFLMEYGGFSAARGRCHLIADHDRRRVVVGDPVDNPGTSVTNAMEQIGLELHRCLGFDAESELTRLYQYAPWDPRTRGSFTARIKFMATAWSMPVWEPIEDELDPFLVRALQIIAGIKPYSLQGMGGLQVLNAVVRLRIEGPPGERMRSLVSRFGTIEHISQHRWYYVDVSAGSEVEAIGIARDVLVPVLGTEVAIMATTPNAPLDQPGSLF